jgi:hypothetical protein
MNTEAANKVAKLCFDHYEKNIPKKLKPSASEWTTMSAILLMKRANDFNSLQVVSMATGSKCLSEKQIQTNGRQMGTKFLI